MAKPMRLVVHVRDGMVTGLTTNDPWLRQELDVVVADHDVEGSSDVLNYTESDGSQDTIYATQLVTLELDPVSTDRVHQAVMRAMAKESQK